MIKKFFSRQSSKTTTEAGTRDFQVQEIWWCAVGGKDARAEGLQKPVLVFRKFNTDMFWGLPLSSQVRKDNSLEFSVPVEKDRTAVLSRMRILHAKRLVRRLGKISDTQLSTLNQAIVKLIHETNPLRDLRAPRQMSRLVTR